MDGGVVENENMVVVWEVPLKDVHGFFDLPQKVLIGEVPLLVCAGSEKNPSRLLSVGRTQPTVVHSDKIGDHQQNALTQGNGFFAGMDPPKFLPIVLVENNLIVESEHSRTSW